MMISGVVQQYWEGRERRPLGSCFRRVPGGADQDTLTFHLGPKAFQIGRDKNAFCAWAFEHLGNLDLRPQFCVTMWALASRSQGTRKVTKNSKSWPIAGQKEPFPNYNRPQKDLKEPLPSSFVWCCPKRGFSQESLNWIRNFGLMKMEPEHLDVKSN